jgi:MFS transporter, DHA1 family, multidrug resistance protein
MSVSSLMTPRKVSAVGALLVALGPISMALYTPAMPQLVGFFGTDVATVKLTLTIYFADFALAQLICGPLSDALGRRPVVIGFTGLYLVGSLIAVAAPSVEVLLLARAVQGVGAAAGVAISRAIVRDLYTGRESIQIMNLIGLMLSIGPALSPTLGGLTLYLFGWHAIFVLMALYGIAILAVFLTVVPETLAHRNPASARPDRLARNYLHLLSDRRFLRPTIILACTNGSLYTLATMLPFVLIDRVGMSPTSFGLGMLAQSGSFMLGSLVVRRLLRSVEGHRLVPVGLGLILAGGALLAALMHFGEPSFLSVMGPIGVMTFGIAFVMPSMMTESLAPFPLIAGSAAALTGFFQMGGGFVGSGIGALIGDPVVALGTVVPLMTLIAFLTHVTLRPDRTPMEQAIADRLVEPQTPAE